MTSNYEAICEENLLRYGTDIGRIGRMLLADRYDERTHFIFELLQNAEDALGRRGAWNGSRKATFTLTTISLALSHFGKPFDEADVRGICGINESTKDEPSIGRFGIGFKSVFTFTDRPEIHSGDEAFAVENYVQPKRVNRRERKSDETLIILPLRSDDEKACQEITEGFKRLGPSALLFLRHIDEINWNIEGDGVFGRYLRSSPELLGPNVQRITLIGQESGQSNIDQNWLVFHRDVFSVSHEKIGRVEVAFSLQADKDALIQWSVQPVSVSPLVVFFPTVVSTNLGFLVQGPYRTTPSRDNIPREDPWNQHLVMETASLLVEAMRWLRDKAMLDTSALRSLPLESEKFPEGSMFAPLFTAVRQAFMEEPLLPRFNGGFVAAPKAKLARTQDLRELFSPEQVAALFGAEVTAWLTSDITPDKTHDIRKYVMHELGIAEVTPVTIVPRLSDKFLEAQSDDWILRLYAFLSGQEAALRRHLDTIPLIRLNDGTHIVTRENGKSKAFLPSTIETEFPTMRRSVCATPEVRDFLISLGITEPDPVDDVIWNVLPKYQLNKLDVDNDLYTRDIEHIRTVFNMDLKKSQREKLITTLRETGFVKVIDAGNGTAYFDRPKNIYLATDRLKQLFAGIPNMMIVDDTYDCLRGEGMRELLEACGAVRYPRTLEAPHALSYDERQELRREAGHEQTSGITDQIEDWELHGFDELIKLLPMLQPEQRAERARLIWESLGDLEERRGRGIFEGVYKWSHYGSYRKDFPAAFVRHLNEAAWLPVASGELQPPRLVIFDTLGWKNNPFLLTKFAFKPPIIDQLAKEAGIDPGILDLLRKLGITSVSDLTSRLDIIELPVDPETEVEPPLLDNTDIYNETKDLYGDDMPDISSSPFDSEDEDYLRTRSKGTNSGQGRSGTSGTPSLNQRENSQGEKRGGHRDSDTKVFQGSSKRAPGGVSGRAFISYVASHIGDGEADPDGLDQITRMDIENKAIESIIRLEPTLRRTPEGNSGFDLYETDTSGKTIRWVEVKSMTGTLDDRPVGLSRTQFDFAREKGLAYWLYVVEHATDHQQARVLRIQDPFGHARTFTFDRGWIEIAQTVPPP